MKHHLTGDINKADLLVDLSNVLRLVDLLTPAKADPNRLQAVSSLLVSHESDASLRLYAVADASLFRKDLYSDTRSLSVIRSWENDGLLEVWPDADRRLLEVSEMTGLRIVTNDLFRGWRRDFPWLQGNTDRVLRIIRRTGDGWVIEPADLGTISEDAVSAYSEKDEFKANNLVAGPNRSPRLDVIERLWRCPETGCHLHDGTGPRVKPPRYRDGKVICNEHLVPLVDHGWRPTVAQIKVLLDGVCARRFTVPSDERVVVGRAPEGGVDLTQWLGPDAVGTDLSRVHLELRLVGERLLVRDRSTNGTWCRSPGAAAVRMESNVEQRFVPGQTLVLTERIALTRSGRSFPHELRTDWPHPVADGSPPALTRPTPPPQNRY